MIGAMSRSLRAALSATLFVLSSGGVAVSQTDDPAAGLTAHDWTLTSLDGTAVPPGARITATFSADGLVSGSGGCNTYSASYQVADLSLTVGPVAATRMSCGDEADALESQYFDLLQGAIAFTVDDAALLVVAETGVLEFGAGGATAAFTSLTDATWTLVELDGAAVEPVAQTATFLPDGTINGSGGCNEFFGGYTEDGSTLTVSALASTRMACEDDVMEAEAAYLDALQTAENWAIAGNELTITTAADVELVFEGVAVEGPTETAAPTAAPATPALDPSATPAVDPSDGASETAGAPSGEIVGVTWQVTEIDEAPLMGMWTITALFGEDGTLSGNAGCNDYTASYQLDGDDLSITALTPGSGGVCDPTAITLEQSYLTLLPFMDSAEIEDGQLRLRSDLTDVEILFDPQ
jgi:heat shock protein HslJ